MTTTAPAARPLYAQDRIDALADATREQLLERIRTLLFTEENLQLRVDQALRDAARSAHADRLALARAWAVVGALPARYAAVLREALHGPLDAAPEDDQPSPA